ncbi:alpha-(1,3)-fucosyltransferase C-like [Brevipalpus obovatus]|uniref:alpha-(1,3)-fucosyltransferase C-like n=1 Tax=Brevipalpus obovatus TaxID=246614 RepID=UPI003D9DCE06
MKCELDCFPANHDDVQCSPIDMNRKIRSQRDIIKLFGRSVMILCIFVFISVLFVLSNPVENAQPLLLRSAHSLPDTKLILLWTPYFSDRKWYILPDNGTAQLSSCTGCRFTNDRSKLNQAVGVVFHGRDIDLNDFPYFQYDYQKWIWYLLESPMYTYGLNKMKAKMECYATYRRDSDIFIPYGEIIPIQFSEMVNSGNNNATKVVLSKDTRKPVAWLVSNCKTKSLREEYVKVLQRYIDVDIYGKCGKSCDNLSLPCHEFIEKNYKFVLALENSFCKDYVTEKLWNSLKYNVVPIVMGGANYSAILPPNSYIDVFNFSSAQNLAEFLKKVSNDDQLYSSYFKWKQSYTIKARSMEQDMCSICRALISPKPCHNHSIKSLSTWWIRDANCFVYKDKN